MTDVLLTVTRGKNVYGTISVDDSGLEDTGKLQWYTSVGIDQIFQRNDILRVGMNLDGAQDGYAKGTRGHNISYTIPYGAHTFTLSYQRSKRRRYEYFYVFLGLCTASLCFYENELGYSSSEAQFTQLYQRCGDSDSSDASDIA